MLFSIVIPVYNVEKYLNECVESILQQVNTINNDCEILLIDDGSTDSSPILCDMYEEKYPGLIKVFHNGKQAYLHKTLWFKRTCGEYIINCDSDDLLEYSMLESVKKIIEKYNNPDIVFINHYTYDGKNKIIGYNNIFTNDQDCSVSRNDVLCEYMSKHSIVSVCGKIVKRSCIDIDKDYTEYGRLSTGEDTLQSIEFFSNASTFVYLNEPLYDYRCGSGMTAKFDVNYYFTFKHIFEQIKKEKSRWNLSDFDKLYAVKVLQTAGRAITQSRYNKWKSVKEQKKYLMSIYNDSMLTDNFKYLYEIKDELQFDHYILLRLLKNRLFFFIILLLDLKNAI